MAISERSKKVMNIIKLVLVWSVLALSVFMMVFTVISVRTVDKTDGGLFGYKFFIVQSDSMSATDFSAGDVIIVKEVELSTLKAGDIITFISQNPESHGQTVTHKIREVTVDSEGNIAFKTYGTTTGEDDKSLATMVIGQYQTRIPKLGYFFSFLRTVPGYIVCILVPFLILIISQAINCVRLFRKYRAEQMAELVAERGRLEEEREKTQRMMEELMELKARMEASGSIKSEDAQTEQSNIEDESK